MEKKAREALERARSKEDERRKAVTKKMASQYCAKIQPTVIALQGVLSKPEINMLAPMIVDSLKSFLKELQAIEANAKAVVNDHADELTIDDMGEVSSKIGAAKKQLALASTIFTSIAKASKS